jgi:hypothetical protein
MQSITVSRHCATDSLNSRLGTVWKWRGGGFKLQAVINYTHLEQDYEERAMKQSPGRYHGNRSNNE